jgi:hypothetical protein
MGTGDPSQYGHRQSHRGIEFLRSRSGFRFKAYAFELASTWMALGGLVCPQPVAASGLSRMVSPGPCRNAVAIWRHKKIAEAVFATKLIGVVQGFVEEYLRAYVLRGVNSMDKPNGRLVLVSYVHCCTSTSSLSTRSSSWALQGDLILERASRLYAFSGYHNRTSLPSRALGRTTGTQEVRPSRSSRTKDSPPQISYAHSR